MWHFSYEYLQEFLGYEPLRSENVLIFSPSRRFSAYNFIYRNAASIILSDIQSSPIYECARQISQLGIPYEGFYWGLKLDL